MSDPAIQKRIFILIDQHTLTRHWIASWLADNLAEGECRYLRDPSQPDPDVDRAEAPALLLLNLGGSGAFDTDAREVIEQCRRRWPDTPIVVLSSQDEISTVVEALKLGVRGYLPFSLDAGLALEAIRFVLAGGTFMPPSTLEKAAKAGYPRAAGAAPGVSRNETERAPPPPANGTGFDRPGQPAVVDGFTRRQTEVLRCLIEGHSNKEIAYRLNMCESTVKVHVQHIMKKIGATNRTQVAFMTHRLFNFSSFDA